MHAQPVRALTDGEQSKPCGRCLCLRRRPSQLLPRIPAFCMPAGLGIVFSVAADRGNTVVLLAGRRVVGAARRKRDEVR